MIQSLQHRGREACGLFASGDSITVVKWSGAVRNFDLVDLFRIFEGKKLQGMVSIGDVVKFQLKEQAVENKYLKDYIADKYPG